MKNIISNNMALDTSNVIIIWRSTHAKDEVLRCIKESMILRLFCSSTSRNRVPAVYAGINSCSTERPAVFPVQKDLRRNPSCKKGRMKGTGPILMAFSIIGILIGLFLINHGLNGNGLSSTITLILGIFVTVKEIIDAIH